MVAALSDRPSVRPSVQPPVRHTFVRNISLKRNFMKFDTLIEGHKENCTMQEP